MQISYAEFFKKASDAGCRTLSMYCRPNSNEVARIFETTVGEFLEADTYPVRFVNSKGTLVNYDDSDAHPIRFDEFVKRVDLMHDFLSNSNLSEARVICLHCAGCGRRVVIDGLHRLAWLGANAKYDAIVKITELSGTNWPAGTPDLNVICNCSRL